MKTKRIKKTEKNERKMNAKSAVGMGAAAVLSGTSGVATGVALGNGDVEDVTEVTTDEVLVASATPEATIESAPQPQESDTATTPSEEDVVVAEPIAAEEMTETTAEVPATDSEIAPVEESPSYTAERQEDGDDIVNGEEIDPDDVDMEDVINVDQIGTVYTVDGENMLAASIHDPNGNDLLMIDVDGDEVFDIITTPDGDIITEVGGSLDVSDAEAMMTQDDADYLAANDYDDSLDFETDITDDIIEV